MTSRTLSLGFLLAGGLVALTGCTRSSVAVHPGPVVESDTKAVSAQTKPAAKDTPAPSGEPFRFPDDQGGKMLGELLAPPQQPPAAFRAPPAPRSLPAPDAVANPEMPLTPNLAGLPRPLLTPPHAKLRPTAPHEEAPLQGYRLDPVGPSVQHLYGGALVHVASIDVELPVALPILARPDADRVPLEDPTADDSLAAALAAVPPVRSVPVPFHREALPDPFENAQTVRLKTPPPEETTPVSTGPQVPK
jgi:hypothetical protein